MLYSNLFELFGDSFLHQILNLNYLSKYSIKLHESKENLKESIKPEFRNKFTFRIIENNFLNEQNSKSTTEWFENESKQAKRKIEIKFGNKITIKEKKISEVPTLVDQLFKNSIVLCKITRLHETTQHQSLFYFINTFL